MSLTVREGALYVDVETWAGMIGVPADEQSRQVAADVPGGELAMDAVAAPLAVVQVQTATPGGVFTHEAWFGADAVALLVDLGLGTERRVVPLPPDHLAAGLARLVGLGPRVVGDRAARPIEERELDSWFGDDAAARNAALGALGADRAWRLVASRVGGHPDDDLLLSVADGAQGGAWLVEPDDEGRLSLEPVSASLLWRHLTSLVPILAEPLVSRR